MALQRSFAGATMTTVTGRPWRCNGASPVLRRRPRRDGHGVAMEFRRLPWSFTTGAAMELRRGCNGAPPKLPAAMENHQGCGSCDGDAMEIGGAAMEHHQSPTVLRGRV
ncbi:hypothetical protein VPH35_111555 [Triticum aestivum]